MEYMNEADLEQFEEVGYFVTDVVIEAPRLQALADEMDRIYAEGVVAAAATGDAAQLEEARGRRAYGQLHTLSAVAAEFAKHPVYLEACRHLIGADADLYYNQAAVKVPGKGRGRTFKWHQDSGYVETVPLRYITCWTAVNDSNLGNGCIWVIPGSHRWGLLEHVYEDGDTGTYSGKNAIVPDESGKIPVEMKAGQVAFFSSLTLHMSGPNTSRGLRRGYVPQYHVPDVRLASNGEPCGDRWPVLRDGRRVDVPIPRPAAMA